IWSEGIKQMDLVIKDGSGGSGHAHKRPDSEKFFPTKMRITVVQVSAGAKYEPSLVPLETRPPALLVAAKRGFKITKHYLNLPIKNGPTRKVTTLVDGREEVRNDIPLADGQPDWWTFMDVSAWRGKTVTLQVDKLREDSTALSTIEQSDEIKGAENLY